jgi:hypothetical protein
VAFTISEYKLHIRRVSEQMLAEAIHKAKLLFSFFKVIQCGLCINKVFGALDLRRKRLDCLISLFAVEVYQTANEDQNNRDDLSC